MKNTLKDNCYLENIVRSVDRNLRLTQNVEGADRIGMLEYVVNYCQGRIEDMKMDDFPQVEDENGYKN